MRIASTQNQLCQSNHKTKGKERVYKQDEKKCEILFQRKAPLEDDDEVQFIKNWPINDQ